MSEAIDFFSNNEISNKKCLHLQKDSNKSLSWENEKTSVFSPKTVTNDETIIRTWYIPIHIDSETGEIKPTAFDDALDKGLSVNRLLYTSIEVIKENAISHAAEMSLIRSPRNYHSHSIALVDNIRNQQAYNLRIFAIYDTSENTEIGISHADVCTILSIDTHEDLTRDLLKKIVRGRLQACFSSTEI